MRLAALAGLLALYCAPAARAQEQQAAQEAPVCPTGQVCVSLSPVEMFDLAGRLTADGETDRAEVLLRSLADNPDPEVRAEARFRLGNLLLHRGEYADAARSYQALIDEKPDATPVRLQLARALALMGREDAARAQLRRASSAGLPDDVARLVDQFQLALRSRRRSGIGLEVGLAPDSNANRATSRSNVALGDAGDALELSPDAQAQSDMGVLVRSQAFWRGDLGNQTNLLLNADLSANLYSKSRFNDIGASIAAGPEWLRGPSRYRASFVVGRRWFGMEPYSDSYGMAGNWLRQINPVSQVQVDLSWVRSEYASNPALDGGSTALSLRYERALSPRLAARISATAERIVAKDPAYATMSFGGEILVSRDLGGQSAYGRVGVSRTRGDEPFALFGERRRDTLVDLEAGLLLRRLSVAGLTPVVRVHHTANRSPLFFYDYRRSRVEVGITREF